MSPKKDPWEPPSNYEGGAWIIKGARMVPLPPGRCPEEPDWVCKTLSKDPTPFDLPVFIIDRITTDKAGRRKIYFFQEGRSSVIGNRWFMDIKEKWFPMPDYPEDDDDEVPEEPKILTRFQREPVI